MHFPFDVVNLALSRRTVRRKGVPEMAEYDRFAEVYDLFMDEIPYGEWCDFLCGLLLEQGVKDGLLLELGCGTGTMTELLARRGYDMTGLDSSPEMLQKALEKRDESGLPILYLCQDMRDFELYGTMAAVVAVCDTMNYLTEDEDVLDTLRLVNNYLDPGGVFIFDLKTLHYYRDVLGDRTEAVNEEEASYIWENSFSEDDNINEYALTIFEKRSDGLYEKAEEYHLQRAFTIGEIRELAEEAGLEFVSAREAVTGAEPSETSERVYVILREKGKEADNE